MAIDPDALRAWVLPTITQTYDETAAILYALSLGIGEDPVDPQQLQFVYEAGLKTLPSMSVILGFPGPWLRDPATGIDYSRVVHGEQHLEVFRPLPLAATVRCVNHVTDVTDRGTKRGAAITIGRELYDEAGGQLVARQTSVIIARGDGGFGSETDSPPGRQPLPLPDREPDVQFTWRVLPQLALIYRLTGDRNPLHADPAVAIGAGFERPILHGLASFGIAAYAAIMALCDGDPNSLRGIGARFTSPVIPGDTLTFHFWHTSPGEAVFRASAARPDRVVLDRGHVRYAA